MQQRTVRALLLLTIGLLLPAALAQTQATSAAVDFGATLVAKQLAATVTCPPSFKDEFSKGLTADYVSCFAWTNGFAPGDVQTLEAFADAAFTQHTPGYQQTNGWDNTPPSATNAYYFADRSVVALVIVLKAGYLVMGAVH